MLIEERKKTKVCVCTSKKQVHISCMQLWGISLLYHTCTRSAVLRILKQGIAGNGVTEVALYMYHVGSKKM